MSKPRKLYIIHVERPDETIWHYIGVTTLPETSQRLAHHMTKKRESAVRNYVNYASRVSMWELKIGVELAQEKALAALDEMSVREHVCPLCMAGNTLLDGKEGFRFFTETPVEVASLRPTESTD
jgi:predicted GIY-YIG superfamily endonuclease